MTTTLLLSLWSVLLLCWSLSECAPAQTTFKPDNADFVSLRQSLNGVKCEAKDPTDVQSLLDLRLFDVAIACAIDTVERNPARSAAYSLLAYAISSRGDHKSMLLAAAQFAKAIKLSPREPVLSLNLGHCFHHARLPAKAIKAYRREFQVDGGKASTLLALLSEYSHGVPLTAQEGKDIALLVATTGVQPHFEIGNEAAWTSRPPVLDGMFAELRPESDEALFANAPLLANTTEGVDKRRLIAGERAITLMRGTRGLFREPGTGSLWRAAVALSYISGMNDVIGSVNKDIGLLSLERHDGETAVISLRRAIFAAPRLTSIYNNLGGVLRVMGNSKAARAALEAGLRRCNESLDEIYQGLSFVAKDESNLVLARKEMLRAIEVNPQHIYWSSYAALFDDNDPDGERLKAYNNALAINVNSTIAFCARAELYTNAAMWDELRSDLPQLNAFIERSLTGEEGSSVISETCLQPFHSTYMPIDPLLQRRIAVQFSMRDVVSVPLPPLPAEPLDGRRMRIGYMSADLGDHPLGRFFRSVFGAHDRKRFHVHCIALEAHDAEETNAAIRKGCETWLDLSAPQTFGDAAKRIRELQLDVLIDLNGWTKGRRPRILAHRPAAVQMLHGWGYIGTSGAPFIDYFISDHVVSPASHAAYHTEKLIRLPYTYFPVSHKDAHPAAELDAIDRVALRGQLGLPQDAIIVANFQSVTKMSAGSVEAWCRAVASQPKALLWLLQPAINSTAERLRTRCCRTGCAGGSHRFWIGTVAGIAH
jgi:predicted O-linked N-acetylglucosamine transferase (SPINDLY family)